MGEIVREYRFYADGVDFGSQTMTETQAKAYAKEYQLTFETDK